MGWLAEISAIFALLNFSNLNGLDAGKSLTFPSVSVANGATSDSSISPQTITIKPTGDQEPFLLKLDICGDAGQPRPQRTPPSTSYVFPQGTSPACQLATVFTLVGSQLYADKELVVTSPSRRHQPLVGGGAGAEQEEEEGAGGGCSCVIDGFALVDGKLRWSHASFAAESAVFCLSPSNTVVAVFDTAHMPSGCILVDLIYVPYTQCFPTISVSIEPPLVSVFGAV